MIREAGACLADITTDNPNVWYELGYALASGKEVILICSKERVDFPFDIRHIGIIRYSTSSGRDFAQLEKSITERLTARLADSEKLQTIAAMSPLSEVEGLSPHETAALVVLMENSLTPESEIDPWRFKQEMEHAGFTSIATNLSVEALVRKNMVEIVETLEATEDYSDVVKKYKIQKSGTSWLLQNQDKLVLRKQMPLVPKPPVRKNIIRTENFDDSDPFADE